jgi:hypothetical protein
MIKGHPNIIVKVVSRHLPRVTEENWVKTSEIITFHSNFEEMFPEK